MPTYNNISQVRKAAEGIISIALQNVVLVMAESLTGYIQSEFYNKYTPKWYVRSERFLDSVETMVEKCYAEVFLGLDYSYKTITDDGSSVDVPAIEVAENANLGIHGVYYQVRREGSFWLEFTKEWTQDRIADEIIKQCKALGLNVYRV